MVQRTVLKVDISCQKCKKKLMKAVSGLEGVDKIELDPSKNTLTVTGNADPIQIIIRTRRTGKQAEVVSIGPPPPLSKQQGGGGGSGGGGDGQKKPTEKQTEDQKKSEQKAQVHVPQTCHVCEQMGIHVGHFDPPLSCCIL